MIKASIPSRKSIGDMLTEASIDAIIAVDAARKIIAWNAAATVIFDKPADTTLGRSLFEILPTIEEDEELVKAVNFALKGLKSFLPATKNFFHRHHLEIHIIPLKEESQVVGVMCLVHDVAHRVKAEEQMEQLNKELQYRLRQLQEASLELASLTHIATHNIKEPLRKVYTGIEHMIKTEAGRLSNNGRGQFRRIQSSLTRIDLLLDDILILSQISIAEKPDSIIDTKEIIDKVTNALYAKIRERKVTITTGDLCNIKAHKNQLYLLLYHLVDNSIKFNQSDTILISITCEKVVIEPGQGIVPGNYYRLTVSDNGMGFDKNKEEGIFQPFQEIAEKISTGSGVGFSMLRKIMEVHGGTTTVESVAGTGSTFHCFFPV